jgi:hypothetical protein
VLAPYFQSGSGVPAQERELVRTLYSPLYQALRDLPVHHR